MTITYPVEWPQPACDRFYEIAGGQHDAAISAFVEDAHAAKITELVPCLGLQKLVAPLLFTVGAAA